jgi:hypothetical protein
MKERLGVYVEIMCIVMNGRLGVSELSRHMDPIIDRQRKIHIHHRLVIRFTNLFIRKHTVSERESVVQYNSINRIESRIPKTPGKL